MKSQTGPKVKDADFADSRDKRGRLRRLCAGGDVFLHTSHFRDVRFTGSIFPASTCYAIEDGDCAFQVLAASGADLTVWGSFPQGYSDKEATVRPTSRATLPNLLLPYRSSASEILIQVATPPGFPTKVRTLLS